MLKGKKPDPAIIGTDHHKRVKALL